MASLVDQYLGIAPEKPYKYKPYNSAALLASAKAAAAPALQRFNTKVEARNTFYAANQGLTKVPTYSFSEAMNLSGYGYTGMFGRSDSADKRTIGLLGSPIQQAYALDQTRRGNSILDFSPQGNAAVLKDAAAATVVTPGNAAYNALAGLVGDYNKYGGEAGYMRKQGGSLPKPGSKYGILYNVNDKVIRKDDVLATYQNNLAHILMSAAKTGLASGVEAQVLQASELVKYQDSLVTSSRSKPSATKIREMEVEIRHLPSYAPEVQAAIGVVASTPAQEATRTASAQLAGMRLTKPLGFALPKEGDPTTPGLYESLNNLAATDLLAPHDVSWGLSSDKPWYDVGFVGASINLAKGVAKVGLGMVPATDLVIREGLTAAQETYKYVKGDTKQWGEGNDFKVADAIWADYAQRYYDVFAYQTDKNGEYILDAKGNKVFQGFQQGLTGGSGLDTVGRLAASGAILNVSPLVGLASAGAILSAPGSDSGFKAISKRISRDPLSYGLDALSVVPVVGAGAKAANVASVAAKVGRTGGFIGIGARIGVTAEHLAARDAAIVAAAHIPKADFAKASQTLKNVADGTGVATAEELSAAKKLVAEGTPLHAEVLRSEFIVKNAPSARTFRRLARQVIAGDTGAAARMVELKARGYEFNGADNTVSMRLSAQFEARTKVLDVPLSYLNKSGPDITVRLPASPLARGVHDVFSWVGTGIEKHATTKTLGNTEGTSTAKFNIASKLVDMPLLGMRYNYTKAARKGFTSEWGDTTTAFARADMLQKIIKDSKLSPEHHAAIESMLIGGTGDISPSHPATLRAGIESKMEGNLDASGNILPNRVGNQTALQFKLDQLHNDTLASLDRDAQAAVYDANYTTVLGDMRLRHENPEYKQSDTHLDDTMSLYYGLRAQADAIDARLVYDAAAPQSVAWKQLLYSEVMLGLKLTSKDLFGDYDPLTGALKNPGSAAVKSVPYLPERLAVDAVPAVKAVGKRGEKGYVPGTRAVKAVAYRAEQLKGEGVPAVPAQVGRLGAYVKRVVQANTNLALFITGLVDVRHDDAIIASLQSVTKRGKGDVGTVFDALSDADRVVAQEAVLRTIRALHSEKGLFRGSEGAQGTVGPPTLILADPVPGVKDIPGFTRVYVPQERSIIDAGKVISQPLVDKERGFMLPNELLVKATSGSDTIKVLNAADGKEALTTGALNAMAGIYPNARRYSDKISETGLNGRAEDGATMVNDGIIAESGLKNHDLSTVVRSQAHYYSAKVLEDIMGFAEQHAVLVPAKFLAGKKDYVSGYKALDMVRVFDNEDAARVFAGQGNVLKEFDAAMKEAALPMYKNAVDVKTGMGMTTAPDGTQLYVVRGGVIDWGPLAMREMISNHDALKAANKQMYRDSIEGDNINGWVLAVPHQFERQLSAEVIKSDNYAAKQLRNPLTTGGMNTWKWLVLSANPKFISSNVIGGLSLMMIYNPRAAVNILTRAMQTAARKNGVGYMSNVVNEGRSVKRSLQYEFKHNIFRSESVLSRKLPDSITDFSSMPVWAQHYVTNFGYTTVSAFEEFIRTNVAIDFLKQDPVFDSFMGSQVVDDYVRGNVDWDGNHRSPEEPITKFEAASDLLLDRDSPHFDAALKQRMRYTTNTVSGNYHQFNTIEHILRNTMMPFYSWQRHSTTAAFRLAVNKPITANVTANLGLYGYANASRDQVPDWMQMTIPVPDVVKEKLGITSEDFRVDASALGFISTPGDMAMAAIRLLTGDRGLTSVFKVAGNPVANAIIQDVLGVNPVTGRIDYANHYSHKGWGASGWDTLTSLSKGTYVGHVGDVITNANSTFRDGQYQSDALANKYHAVDNPSDVLSNMDPGESFKDWQLSVPQMSTTIRDSGLGGALLGLAGIKTYSVNMDALSDDTRRQVVGAAVLSEANQSLKDSGAQKKLNGIRAWQRNRDYIMQVTIPGMRASGVSEDIIALTEAKLRSEMPNDAGSLRIMRALNG